MNENKPRIEVTTETREELHLLDLDRAPRPVKSSLEAKYFDGAHEVHLSERAFKPRHSGDLDENRAFVDALEIRRRELPPLPDQRRVDVAVPPRVPDHYREPLEAVIQGSLVGVETVHRVGTGTVVEAQWEDAQGALQKALFLVEGTLARPYDEVTSRIDTLPEPAMPQRSPVAEALGAEPEPAPVSDEPRKKGLLKFGRSKPKEEKPASEDKGKRRFGFGKT
jgi:hypothetical protein